MLTLEAAMPNNAPPQHPYGAGAPNAGGYQPHAYDVTGQNAPPGVKPRVTATLWEDEGSLCFQVEAKGVCVARREGRQALTSTPAGRELMVGL